MDRVITNTTESKSQIKEELRSNLISFNNHTSLINDRLLISFRDQIKKNLQNHLTALILYGSRARGDAKEFSDYDFLIIIDGKPDEQIEDVILDIEVNVLNQFDKLTTCLIWNIEDWNLKKRFPIGRNILKEGVLL